MDTNNKYKEDFEKENLELINLLKNINQEEPSEEFDSKLFDEISKIKLKKPLTVSGIIAKISDYFRQVRMVEVYAFGTTIVAIFMLVHIFTLKPTIVEKIITIPDSTNHRPVNSEIITTDNQPISEVNNSEAVSEIIINEKLGASRGTVDSNEPGSDVSTLNQVLVRPSTKGGTKKSKTFNIKVENNTEENIILLLNGTKIGVLPPWVDIELYELQEEVVLYAYYKSADNSAAEWGPKPFSYVKDKKYVWKLNK